MNQDIVTENLADFGMREIKMLRDLLNAWLGHGLPDDFQNEGVRPAMNRHSGYVFLTNDEYEVAMLSGEKLESFYSSPYEGKEGFFEDLLDEYGDMHPEDRRWLHDIATNLGREDALPGEAADAREE